VTRCDARGLRVRSGVMDPGLAATLALVSSLVVLVWASVRKSERDKIAIREYELRAQDWMEAKASELIADLPELSDQSIARALSDELENARETNAAYWRWANVETVSRVRRTMAIALAREQRRDS
jgi:hypothetical protein